jgi:sortase (surface protein transpeptidase)
VTKASRGLIMKRLSRKQIAIFGCIATVLGLVGILASFSLQSQPTYAVTQQVPVEQQPVAMPPQPAPTGVVTGPVSGNPTRITIASVGIDLPVINGYYNQKTGGWTLTPTNAQFATPSKQPNNTTGTTYIYGHDTRAVFHPLQGVKTGAEATIVTDNGYRFVYAFKESVITTPYAVNEVTANSSTPRLSLQTCYGPTSADRRIFHFDLVRVEKV